MKSHRFLGVALLTCCSLMARPTCANSFLGADEGKFLLTAGFSDLEGTGGGGLVPLAFISGYGSSDSWGANAHVTNVELRDYHVYTYGVAAGFLDRVELTYTHQQLNITSTALNGLGVRQEVVGAKLKLCGNAVYQQDSPLPQIAAGVEYKHNDGIKNAADVGLAGLISPIQLGATAAHAADYYLAATKVFLAQSVVVNVVLRETKANQFGFLGFGGDRKKNYSLRPEGTLAYLLTRRFAVGAEIRSAPSNLSVDSETAAWDAFAAWAPTKNISLVAAYLNLGSILAPVTHVARHQDGAYLSIQVGF
jgi:Protein of unknown function (DUF3034)